MSIHTIIENEARLAILKALADQPNKALTSEAMRRLLLSDLLIDKSRAWVEMQFAYLEEVKTILIHKAATVQIAQLTERGELYLQNKVVITGIQPPSSGG